MSLPSPAVGLPPDQPLRPGGARQRCRDQRRRRQDKRQGGLAQRRARQRRRRSSWPPAALPASRPVAARVPSSGQDDAR